MRKVFWTFVALSLISIIISSKASKNKISNDENFLEDPIVDEQIDLIDSENCVYSNTEEDCNDCGSEIDQNLGNDAIQPEIKGQNIKVEETPPTYNVKDEKICRKKREAERLSKTIKKTLKAKDSKKVSKEQINANNEEPKVESENEVEMEVQEQEMEVEEETVNKKRKREINVKDGKLTKEVKGNKNDQKYSKNQKSEKLKSDKKAKQNFSQKEKNLSKSHKTKENKNKSHKGGKSGHKKGKKSEL